MLSSSSSSRSSSSSLRRARRRGGGGGLATSVATAAATATLTVVSVALCAAVSAAAAAAPTTTTTTTPPAPPPPSRRASATPPGEFPPIYGNYCGFQNSACTDESFRLAPVDALDAACKRHDRCWCKGGSMDCGCDAALLASARELRKAQAPPSSRASSSSEAARTMAGAVVAYFSIAPCVCRERRFCVPTCGARTGCTWGGPECRQAVSPGLGGVCALKK